MSEEVKKVNGQLYENSQLNGSSVEEAYDEDISALFNDKKPNLAVIHEKPEHRVMIHMKVAGWSNREIAHATGYTDAWVSQILRQPWARDQIIREIDRSGRDGVEAIIEASVKDSVWKVIELRDSAPKPEIQLAAARDLIDRALGKPTQKVESTSKNLNISASLSDLEKQIKTLEEEEAKLIKTV